MANLEVIDHGEAGVPQRKSQNKPMREWVSRLSSMSAMVPDSMGGRAIMIYGEMLNVIESYFFRIYEGHRVPTIGDNR